MIVLAVIASVVAYLFGCGVMFTLATTRENEGWSYAAIAWAIMLWPIAALLMAGAAAARRFTEVDRD